MMNKLSLTKQSGAVLIVSLIMLLLLTLIGVSSSQVTGLEEKMASNSRDQNLAFQAAETALRAGEAKIESKDTIPEFASTNEKGLFSDTETMPDYFGAQTWIANDSFIFNSELTEVATQPRYFIKYVTTSEPPAIINCDYNSGPECTDVVSYFIVTARGTGALDTSKSYLRLYYGKKFY